jgi:hypothetical protein
MGADERNPFGVGETEHREIHAPPAPAAPRA